ncbi:MAG: DNA recombination-dependent growth factor C [Gammaproteobacteria bacterium]|jgi:DNA recombination-dependent growth factor C|tara:strand:+ start:4268 stop:5410 length:1143 start_codon:yes stop_codon:yes gene_type:complete
MKNIHVFAAELPGISVLESKVEEEQGVIFTSLTDNQWSNLGFKVDRQFVALDNGYRIDFTYSAKDYPKAQVLERINEVADTWPHEPSKEEMGKIAEQVNADFCARSIVKTVNFSAFYHEKKQTLIFDSKAALAQRALGLLIKLVESVETKTLHCSGISNSLTTNMLDQLNNSNSEYDTKLYFAGFEVGDLLVMQNKDKDVARFKGDYPTENIKELIEQGYEIKEIALSKDGLSFYLNHNFKIKGVKELFEVEGAMFDNADDYEIHKQAIALELMTGHCEQLRNAFDKQSSTNEQEDLDQDDGNESLIAEHNAKHKDSNGNDAFYEEAKAFAIEQGQVSISRTQRKFRIGYNRAARLIEQLEDNGIVSAPDYKGQRTVLIK